MEIKLEINAHEVYKDASLEELETALSDYKEVCNKADTIVRQLRAMVCTAKAKKASKLFDGINEGDKVIVKRQYKSFYKGELITETIEGHFYAGITNVAKESVYCGQGPFVNLAIAKKDGTMGKRCHSYKVESVISIEKV